MISQQVKFTRGANPDFIRTLRSRVVEYFEENNISKYGNWRMVVKTIVMLSLLFGPWLVMIVSGTSSVWLVLGMYTIMALGKSGVGFSVMHDACHGSYSRYPWVNKILS